MLFLCLSLPPYLTEGCPRQKAATIFPPEDRPGLLPVHYTWWQTYYPLVETSRKILRNIISGFLQNGVPIAKNRQNFISHKSIPLVMYFIKCAPNNPVELKRH